MNLMSNDTIDSTRENTIRYLIVIVEEIVENRKRRRRRRRRKKEEKANGGIRTSEKFRNHFALETLLVADILLRFDGIRFGRDRGTIVVPKVPAFRYYRWLRYKNLTLRRLKEASSIFFWLRTDLKPIRNHKFRGSLSRDLSENL